MGGRKDLKRNKSSASTSSSSQRNDPPNKKKKLSTTSIAPVKNQNEIDGSINVTKKEVVDFLSTGPKSVTELQEEFHLGDKTYILVKTFFREVFLFFFLLLFFFLKFSIYSKKNYY